MNKEAQVLDALVWSTLTEQARVARISNRMVRDFSRHQNVTQVAVKDAVRATMPPHGRAGAICGLVAEEIDRQRPIFNKRQDARQVFERYLEHQARRSTRLNVAYASAFNRPLYEPRRTMPDESCETTNWEARAAWQKIETARDKGDECASLMIYRGYTVALVEGVNDDRRMHIASTKPGETIVRTYLRDDCKTFAQAAIILCGREVQCAFARGLPVETDWVGRRTTIHYPNRDVELSWRTKEYNSTTDTYGRTRVSHDVTITHGTESRPDLSTENE